MALIEPDVALGQPMEKHNNTLVPYQVIWYLPYLFCVYVTVAIAYFIWRIGVSTSWNAWFVWPLLAFEGYNIFFTLVYLLTTTKHVRPIWRAPLEGKTVDIFIPTYNEPAQVVCMTAIGAGNVEGARRVYVLDDGKRKEIKKMCAAVGATYLARDGNDHAKAGNMNFGISHSDADFLLFVDCDHVPHRDFLERTLGYFKDEKLALVQTPQVFYNGDSFQHRSTRFYNQWSEQSMFYESIQPGKNRFNAAFFCGSGALLRHAAIKSVGGFATETATEDIHTSLRLHAKGWRTLFVHEYLAFGLAPEDLREYHRQRVRWGAGSLGLLFRSKDSPLWARGLSLWQRLLYIDSALAHAYGLQKLFYYLLPAAILITIPWYTGGLTNSFWTFLVGSIMFGLFSYSTIFLFSRKTYHPMFTEQYNIANIFAHLEALRGIIRMETKFGVSLKLKRFRETTYSYFLIHILLAVLFAAPFIAIAMWVRAGFSPVTIFFQSAFVASLFWNGVNLVFLLPFVLYLRRFSRKTPRPFRISLFKPIMLTKPKKKGRIMWAGLYGCVIQTDSALPVSAVTFTLSLLEGKEAAFTATLVSSRWQKDGVYSHELAFADGDIHQKTLWTECIFQLVSNKFKMNYEKIYTEMEAISKAYYVQALQKHIAHVLSIGP